MNRPLVRRQMPLTKDNFGGDERRGVRRRQRSALTRAWLWPVGFLH